MNTSPVGEEVGAVLPFRQARPAQGVLLGERSGSGAGNHADTRCRDAARMEGQPAESRSVAAVEDQPSGVVPATA